MRARKPSNSKRSKLSKFGIVLAVANHAAMGVALGLAFALPARPTFFEFVLSFSTRSHDDDGGVRGHRRLDVWNWSGVDGRHFDDGRRLTCCSSRRRWVCPAKKISGNDQHPSGLLKNRIGRDHERCCHRKIAWRRAARILRAMAILRAGFARMGCDARCGIRRCRGADARGGFGSVRCRGRGRDGAFPFLKFLDRSRLCRARRRFAGVGCDPASFGLADDQTARRAAAQATAQLHAARRMLVGSTISRTVAALRENEAAKPDATTQILLGAAAVLAAGWIVATRFGSTASGRQGRR